MSDLNIDLIHNTLITYETMVINMYRSDRTLVKVQIRTHQMHNDDSKILICAHSRVLDGFHCEMMLNVDETGTFSKVPLLTFINTLMQQVNSYKECCYCQSAFASDFCKFCPECA